jgi:hypothetical protein
MTAHPYSVSEGRGEGIWVWLVLLVISISLAVLLVFIIVPLLTELIELSPPTQLDLSELRTALALFRPVVQGSPLLICLYIVYALFDKWAWRWRFVRQGPNLNGEWRGALVSNEKPTDPLQVTLKIEQTWSKIIITLKSDKTFSHSLNASLSFEGLDRVKLINTYFAEATTEPPVINRHYGTNIIHFRIEGRRLVEISGIYFTERNQGNNGSFRLELN